MLEIYRDALFYGKIPDSVSLCPSWYFQSCSLPQVSGSSGKQSAGLVSSCECNICPASREEVQVVHFTGRTIHGVHERTAGSPGIPISGRSRISLLKFQQVLTFGILGQNGSGKSTLLSILAGVLEPSAGTFTINGKVSAILELGSGFHPEFSGRDNVFMYGSIMGLSKADIDARYC